MRVLLLLGVLVWQQRAVISQADNATISAAERMAMEAAVTASEVMETAEAVSVAMASMVEEAMEATAVVVVQVQTRARLRR